MSSRVRSIAFAGALCALAGTAQAADGVLIVLGAEMFSVGHPEEQGFSGVPVRSVSTARGREVTTEITEVGRKTFPDATFEAPAGYQKTSFMAGRGRGRN